MRSTAPLALLAAAALLPLSSSYSTGQPMWMTGSMSNHVGVFGASNTHFGAQTSAIEQDTSAATARPRNQRPLLFRTIMQFAGIRLWDASGTVAKTAYTPGATHVIELYAKTAQGFFGFIFTPFTGTLTDNPGDCMNGNSMPASSALEPAADTSQMASFSCPVREQHLRQQPASHLPHSPRR